MERFTVAAVSRASYRDGRAAYAYLFHLVLVLWTSSSAVVRSTCRGIL